MNWNTPLTNPYNTGPTGWTCPKCGKVYSPMTSECYKCNNPGTWGPTCGTTAALQPLNEGPTTDSMYPPGTK